MTITQAQQFWLESDFVLELLKQIPASVFWKDKNSVFLGCNDTFAYSLGLSSPEEVIGKTDYDLPTTKEESDAFRADDKQVIESKKPKLNIEEHQTLSDGRKVILLTNKVPLLDKEKNVIGVLCIYYDITERKKAEEALRQAKIELATQRSKMIAKMAAQLAHDIQSPLCAIDLIVKSLPNIPSNSGLTIFNATKRITDIADHLLLKYKNTDSNDVNEITNEHIPTVLEQIIAEKRIQLDSKKINLTLDIASNANDAYALFNLSDFNRILSNLINNAIEAINDCGTIKINLHKEDGFYGLEIADDGCGIPEEILPKIIKEGISYNKKSGSGLGLSHAIKKVKEWNGLVDIKSEKGVGTKVIIRLPVG